jgi:hypothetical protein
VKGEGVTCKKKKDVFSSDDSILAYGDVTFGG